MLAKLFGLQKCNGIWSSVVLMVTLATLFVLFSCTKMYKMTNKLTNMKDKGIETISSDNIPTTFGFALHTFLFTLIVTLLIWLGSKGCWGN